MRIQTTPVRVGKIIIGGGAPVVVQSMTNTPTENIAATAAQSFALWKAGSELVRITVNDAAAAAAVPAIYDKLIQMGWHEPLLVGDFHYNGHQLLNDYPETAKVLAKYRINPGNVGFGAKQDKQFSTIVEHALKHDKPIRIGVNWGSLDQALLAHKIETNLALSQPEPMAIVIQEALVESALQSANFAQKMGVAENKIVLSCKVSEVSTLISVYRKLAERSNFALHLGLTEAGMSTKGIVATAVAFGVLLQEGIGDTIRASLTPEAGGDRTQEVRVCQEVLQAMGLRQFRPAVTACPGCGRTTSTVFQSLAARIQKHIDEQMPIWKSCYPGVEAVKIAVMGCIVNGPGESKHADIGISLPGTGEMPKAPVFIEGKKVITLQGEHLADEFIQILEGYLKQRFAVQITT